MWHKNDGKYAPKKNHKPKKEKNLQNNGIKSHKRRKFVLSIRFVSFFHFISKPGFIIPLQYILPSFGRFVVVVVALVFYGLLNSSFSKECNAI